MYSSVSVIHDEHIKGSGEFCNKKNQFFLTQYFSSLTDHQIFNFFLFSLMLNLKDQVFL